jgi:hypothetical protein
LLHGYRASDLNLAIAAIGSEEALPSKIVVE